MSINHFLFTRKDKNTKIVLSLFEVKVLIFKVFITVAVIIPKKLNMNGNHFKLTERNSASTKKRLLGKIKIEVDQKSVPKPIKKSLVKKPIKILPKDKTVRGKIIKNEDSWIRFNKIRVPLKLFMKVK